MNLADISAPEVQAAFKALPPFERLAKAWRLTWLHNGLKHQVLPPGDWWSIWLMLAGRGAGKTRTAAEQLGWWAWENPNTRWLVAAPTSADVRGTCFEGDSGLVSVIPAPLIEDYNKSMHEIRLVNGSLIKGIPASEPERFRGPQFHGGWADELAAWDYLQEAWDMMQFGLRLGKKTRLICTTTPKPKDLLLELIAREGDDVVLTTASTYDNIHNLSDNFKRQILAYEGTKLGRQEIYAEIIDPEDGGIIKREWFKLWPDGKAFPKFEYIIQSYDCAASEKTINDPTAATTWGIFKPLDGPMAVMLIDAWQDRLQYPDLRPKVIKEFAVLFGEGKEVHRVDLILIEDKSAGISLIQDLQRAHLPVMAYNPGKADKVQRLNIVSHIIARGRVWIPESSKKKGFVRDWAEGFVSQVCAFPETTHDDYVDTCVDSLTQVQVAVGTKAIKDIGVGELVATPKGLRRVTAVHDNGIKEVWSVDGLLATAEHMVMTQDGWVRVDCLSQGVHTVPIYGGAPWALSQAWRWSSRLSSMAENITATRRAITRRIGDIFQGLGLGCTGMCGCSIAGRYLTGCTFTTSTAIRQTTPLRTLLASLGQSIGLSTGVICRRGASLRSRLSTWTGFGQRPPCGTGPLKASSGTGGMSASLWLRCGQGLAYSLRGLSVACGAALRVCGRLTGACSAALAAKPLSQDSVLVRRVTNTRTMRHVFDLTVEGEHCYYANGMLVHNCSQALRYLRDSSWLEVDPPPADEWDSDDYADTGRQPRQNPYAM